MLSRCESSLAAGMPRHYCISPLSFRLQFYVTIFACCSVEQQRWWSNAIYGNTLHSLRQIRSIHNASSVCIFIITHIPSHVQTLSATKLTLSAIKLLITLCSSEVCNQVSQRPCGKYIILPVASVSLSNALCCIPFDLGLNVY